MGQAFESNRGVAHPWLCDVMRHLNTRNYMAAFDDAGMHFLSALGYDFAEAQAGGFGWADVNVELDLKAEVPQGVLFRVESSVVKLGGKSITVRHAMTDLAGEAVFATATVVTVFFDMSARKAATIPDNYRDAAEQYMAPVEAS